MSKSTLVRELTKEIDSRHTYRTPAQQAIFQTYRNVLDAVEAGNRERAITELGFLQSGKAYRKFRRLIEVSI